MGPAGSYYQMFADSQGPCASSQTILLVSADETPVCIAKGDGECDLVAPKSTEYCAGQADSVACPRFQDFKALFMRGEEQVAEDTAEATAATNSLVFNAFIWLQVRTLSPYAMLTLQM